MNLLPFQQVFSLRRQNPQPLVWDSVKLSLSQSLEPCLAGRSNSGIASQLGQLPVSTLE